MVRAISIEKYKENKKADAEEVKPDFSCLKIGEVQYRDPEEKLARTRASEANLPSAAFRSKLKRFEDGLSARPTSELGPGAYDFVDSFDL